MANAGVTAGYNQLSGLYGQGRDALTTGANTASNLYAGLGQTFNNLYGGGANAYGDASGANGVAGLQRANDAFKNSGQYGAYGFSLDQGLQALNRAHAAAGNLSSGNADTDAMKFATGLAGQTYNNYLQGLQPYLGYAGQGALASTQGQANAATGLASGLNASFDNQGNAANTAQTAIGNNNAGAELNNYKVGANLFNGIMGGLNFLGGGGVGNIVNTGKSLFSAFV